MTVNYLNQELIIPKRKEPAIFLAGSTQTDWRKEAIRILELLEFNGIVYFPEAEENQNLEISFGEQKLWQEKAMQHSTCILLWVESGNSVTASLQIALINSILRTNRDKFVFGFSSTIDIVHQMSEETVIDNLEDLILEAIICATEEKIFGMSKKTVREFLSKRFAPSNGCTCTHCMNAWKKELQTEFVSLLQYRAKTMS